MTSERDWMLVTAAVLVAAFAGFSWLAMSLCGLDVSSPLDDDEEDERDEMDAEI